MSKRQKQLWRTGDYFSMRLTDGSHSVGQVIGSESGTLRNAICVFYLKKFFGSNQFSISEIGEHEIISVQFVTTDLLDSGDWPVIDNGPCKDPSVYFPMDALRSNRFVGLKIIGAGIMIKFMDACFGLIPWDSFHDPNYLDKLLYSLNRKPQNIFFK